MAKLTDIALLGLAAFLIVKFKDVFKVGEDVFKGVFEHGEEVGKDLGKLYAEGVIYPQFEQDVIAKWVAEGYTYIGKFDYQDSMIETTRLVNEGWEVTSQASRAGSLAWEEDKWLMFKRWKKAPISYIPTEEYGGAIGDTFGVTGGW